MNVLVNDANILIDLAKIGLIDKFSDLNFDLYTTDFVLEELNQDQQISVQELINLDKIGLITTETIEDFQGINDLLEKASGLSFQDCSIWYYSKKMGGTLITGDGKLRKAATKDGIEVRGIIYILDEILRQGKITFAIAIEKIELLYKLNDRLPRGELPKRVKLWRNKKIVGQNFYQ